MTAEARSGPSPARVVATRVLLRVAKDRAFAATALDAEIRRARLSARDAALATEIVYGTLRALPRLDDILAQRVKRGGKLDPLTRAALRAGAYQLQCLSRVPPHAVVDDTVSIVRRERGARVGGFVNAVLRGVANARPAHPEPPRATCVPDWLAQALFTSLGDERASTFLRAAGVPPLTLHVHTARIAREALAERLRSALPEARIRLGEVAPSALLVWGGGDPRRWPGYDEGWFSVQEEGAQAVGWLAGAREGERVVDACAGHGGKTLWLAASVGAAGQVVALDLHEQKLAHIEREAARLGLAHVPLETRAVDLTVGLGGLVAPYDRVVVDAPCTGLGTLHRRPELVLRAEPDAASRLSSIQSQILARCAALLRPGGALVYAVCSPLEAEGAAVARDFEARHPGFTRRSVGAGPAPDPDGIVRIGPWLASSPTGGPDIYQVVTWVAA